MCQKVRACVCVCAAVGLWRRLSQLGVTCMHRPTPTSARPSGTGPWTAFRQLSCSTRRRWRSGATVEHCPPLYVPSLHCCWVVMLHVWLTSLYSVYVSASQSYRADFVTGHGRRQAWAREATCPLPLEMRKLVFIIVTNCTLEYLNRQPDRTMKCTFFWLYDTHFLCIRGGSWHWNMLKTRFQPELCPDPAREFTTLPQTSSRSGRGYPLHILLSSRRLDPSPLQKSWWRPCLNSS